MMDIELNGVQVPPPIALPWYPGELAWQLNIAKSEIKKDEALKKLHKFMIAEQVLFSFFLSPLASASSFSLSRTLNL